MTIKKSDVAKPATAAKAADTTKDAANIKPADDFEASGAIIEPGAKEGVDMSHPAVDANPRENTTADQNRIDFNDPTLSQSEAVEKNLDDAAAK